MTTPRDLVHRTLEFKNTGRVPRQLWVLPWADNHYPDELRKIKDDFPDDIVLVEGDWFTSTEGFQTREGDPEGDPYAAGTYLDVWNCKFSNSDSGYIGEVKHPLIREENWEDRDLLRTPEACLRIDVDAINSFCEKTDRFVLAPDWARPFERMQFIRGTEQLYIDLITRPGGMFEVLEKVHDYYCRMLETWANTGVDGLWFMDDWGAQSALLISPDTWVELFKPLYRDYIDIAHSHGKKIFMHSDGYILDIIPHLIELGLDAVNSQVFCMGLENLQPFRGKLTFWGEIDRQHMLPYGRLDDIDGAVRSLKDTLWADGGCIAQCEFGVGARPENVYRVYETWNKIV